MLTKKYYDGFIVHDILDKHLEPGKMMEVLTAFSKAKGVDAVEVIRCKDCKYFVDEEDQSYCIEMMYGQCDGNGFCAWAERKEE